MKQKVLIILTLVTIFLSSGSRFIVNAGSGHWWSFQSVDTMKYSRDLSRELLYDPKRLAAISEEQVAQIADLGATHVAIATPYDEEFLPVMVAWVAAARRHNLHVWFRGNWSGWEGWFEYDSLTPEEHLNKTVAFIESHPDLFESGDYFSACPECENGGPGDPRYTKEVKAYRQFLIAEHDAMITAFRGINKNVNVSLNSMNGDVAELIMDQETTKALGGYIVIDHYVGSPKQLDTDITDFAKKSGGKVILGEFGAPIPDIHGDMTDKQQAAWLDQALTLLEDNKHLAGLNYWTNMGGSTALWTESGTAKEAVQVLHNHYNPKTVSGVVRSTAGERLNSVAVITKDITVSSDDKGLFDLPYKNIDEVVTVSKTGYTTQYLTIDDLITLNQIELSPVKNSWIYSLKIWFYQLFSS